MLRGLMISKLFAVPVAVVAAAGLVVGMGPVQDLASRNPGPAVPGISPAESSYLALATLPVQQDEVDPSPEALERQAISMAAGLGAVLLEDGSEAACPPERLVVSWVQPGEQYVAGAYIEPVGPRPTEPGDVNGVVVCAGSEYSFMGFEASWSDEGWTLYAVPDLGSEDGDHAHQEGAVEDSHGGATDHEGGSHRDGAEAEGHGHGAEHGEGHRDGADHAPAAPKPPTTQPAASFTSASIEGYAAYEPQRICDPTPKPGTSALREQLLSRYPGTRSLGIARACSVGGRSEHKEGRALDWGVLVDRPSERAAAESFIAALMATDSAGNRHAMARRMGVMYVIWNRQVWSAYRPDAGWRPYTGVSPHTDHVHVSLSWDGAMGRTSWWSGDVTDGGLHLAGDGTISGAPDGNAKAASGSEPSPAPSPSPSGESNDERWRDDDGDDDDDDLTPEQLAERDRLRAWRADAKQEREEARELRKAQHEHRKALAEQAREEEKQRREEEKQRRKQEAEEARQAVEEARQAAEERARQEREQRRQEAEVAKQAAKDERDQAKDHRKAGTEQRKEARGDNGGGHAYGKDKDRGSKSSQASKEDKGGKGGGGKGGGGKGGGGKGGGGKD